MTLNPIDYERQQADLQEFDEYQEQTARFADPGYSDPPSMPGWAVWGITELGTRRLLGVLTFREHANAIRDKALTWVGYVDVIIEANGVKT